MMSEIIFVILFFPVLLFGLNDDRSSSEYFWQITDIHWNVGYSEFGDEFNECHDSSTKTNISIGFYGNYLCDTPEVLVHSALHLMKSVRAKPSFILWTGDNAEHSDVVTFPVVLRVIQNLTSEVVSVFGASIPVIPVLGNHDTYPSNAYPPSGEDFYGRYLSEGGWGQVIPEESWGDFKKGGYHRARLHSGLDVLAVNTNLYYKFNELGQGLPDPGGQFQWMRRCLQEAKDQRRKVIVAAHEPPGYWVEGSDRPYFNETYNNAYVDLMNEFGGVVMATIYGHEHMDSFRFFRDENGDLKTVGFVAPSINPYASNPSVRLYQFTPQGLLDYDQFVFNLTEANNSPIPASCRSRPKFKDAECLAFANGFWKLHYSAREAYAVPSLSNEDMEKVFKRLASNDTYFQMYYLNILAGMERECCNSTCRRVHLCASFNLKSHDFEGCVERLATGYLDLIYSNFPRRLGVREGFWCVVGLLGVVVVGCGVVVAVWRCRANSQPSSRSPPEWGNEEAGYVPLTTTELD